MSVYWKVIGVVVVGVGCFLAGGSCPSEKGMLVAEPTKGMLVAEPALTTVPFENILFNLTGFRECNVLVLELPDALKDSLTREDIEKWTANRLMNMGIRVVSGEDQEKTYLSADKSTDEKMPAAQDRRRSTVSVRVHVLRTPTGVICANVVLLCWRGVFIHPGYFGTAIVWGREMLLYFGALHDSKEKIKEALNELLDLLEQSWKLCNP
jgi:hypothetical protein